MNNCTHQLKIEETYFNRLIDGTKTCELRFNDRDYQAGDEVQFKIPIEPIAGTLQNSVQNYRCTSDRFKITHVLTYPKGLRDGWVILSIKLMQDDETIEKDN